jgi:hypothetical protein
MRGEREGVAGENAALHPHLLVFMGRRNKSDDDERGWRA